MAKIEGIAPIIRAALTTLEAQWAGHVAVYNAEAANRIDLELPKPSIQPGFQSGGGYVFGAEPVMDAYPVVEVSALEGSFGPFGVGQAGVGDADSNPRLNVVVWLQGVSGEVPDLYEAALGYVRIVAEILTVDGALGTNAEVSGAQEDAITWRIDVIPGGAADVEREFRKWKVPVQMIFVIEAVETWV